MGKIRIAHTADIQVKIREKDLVESYESCLNQIHDALITENIDIYLIAGDLAEYPEPNDAERKIIYAHIAKVLTIPTIKEVVVMLGNHDLLVDKKQNNTNKGSNPIDTFNNFLSLLDKNLSKKLTYLKKQEQYISKFDETLGYISYSLEDGLSNGNNINHELIDYKNIYNISIYHDILKEYVDETKLPVRKEKYALLASVEDFKTPLILAGDIHKNWRSISIGGEKEFIYPGSPIQMNFGEGSYHYIKKKANQQKKADEKVFKIIDVDTIEKTYDIRDYALNDYVSYITLDFNTLYFVDTFEQQLIEILTKLKWGSLNTFIKLKLSNIYLKHELKIFNIVNDFASKAKSKVFIETTYDKFVIGEDKLRNKENEEEELSEEYNIESADFSMENLVLDDDKLAEFFNEVLMNHSASLQKEVADEELVESILGSIRSLFAEQLSISLKSTPSYSVNFKSIECNVFMNLGANKIPLNNEGITKITGTNGIGKTTLYTMMRWLIDDEVLENMSKKSKTKNSLHVFNDKLIDIDNVAVRLVAEVNNTPIAITRTVSRTWKTNTNDEMKQSVGWKNHISSINKTIKLQVFKKDVEPKVFTGEEADKLIRSWFGNSTQTIMILNQHKILSMLNLPSAELTELVLNYIGVDYLSKLEENLDLVKSQYNLTKPKRNKEDLKFELFGHIERREEVEKIQEKLKVYITNEKNNLKVSLENLSTDQQNLVDMGNIDNLIDAEKSTIKQLTEKLEHIIIGDKKAVPLFELVSPKESSYVELDEKQVLIVNDYKKASGIIEENKQIIDTSFNQLLDNITISYNKLQDDYNVKFGEITNLFKNENEKYLKDISENFLILENDFKSKLAVNKEQFNELETKHQNDKLSQNEINKKLVQYNKEIKDGVCSLCGKVLNDNKEAHEKHVVKLKQEIESLEKELLTLSETILIDANHLTEQKQYIDTFINCISNASVNNIQWFNTNDIGNTFMYAKDKIDLINNLVTNNKFVEQNLDASKHQNLSHFNDGFEEFVGKNILDELNTISKIFVNYVSAILVLQKRNIQEFQTYSFSEDQNFKPLVTAILNSTILITKETENQNTIKENLQKVVDEKNKLKNDLSLIHI